MTALRASPRVAWLAFAISLVALSASLAIRSEVSVWVSTAAAGAIGIAATLVTTRIEVRVSPRWIVIGAASGLAMAIATHVLYPIGVAIVPGLEREVAALYDELRAPPGPRAAVPLLLLVVLAEELVFRGLLVALLERWGVKRSAVLVAATALYTVPQIAGGSLVLIALAIACGALWTWQRQLSGGIVVPLITHALWDVIVLVLVPL
ncbi:type II CAAX prenyl endopeptidase Rce1 family protein [Sandaracinus amylolyticus]|uniref:Putative INTEGRAL MEMBRANE PROTEIN n=1 Tax=Sandaracinus amylolyticus TaxID=927083 RepID=A0A0F6W7K0_9BACT|nr:CPBP family glutamic-type intramembrane protease [Sandaracinus amylolyticus]AKF09525.1 Putative INTEGRAL MEMBRANE PROTEIN [Sandaracinus amylolyticus]